MLIHRSRTTAKYELPCQVEGCGRNICEKYAVNHVANHHLTSETFRLMAPLPR